MPSRRGVASAHPFHARRSSAARRRVLGRSLAHANATVRRVKYFLGETLRLQLDADFLVRGSSRESCRPYPDARTRHSVVRNRNANTRKRERQPRPACVAAYVRRSARRTPTAPANRSMLSMLTFRSARSTEPTYVRCKPARSASASCESERANRALRRWAAKTCRADVRAFGDTPEGSGVDDYKSTDYR